MLGVLKGIIDRTQPLVPQIKIEWSGNSFVVTVKRQRYTMGILPKYIGETEEELASITIESDEDNDRILVIVKHDHDAVHRIPVTMPNSGHLAENGHEYQWRNEDAAKELADYLKDLAS